MDLSKNRNLIIFFSVVFLSNFFFKLIYIGTPSLWYDEIISANDTQLDFGHIKHEAEWDKNPPFYHYVLWVWSKMFGITEIALRSMSAFFNSLTAILIFIISRKISTQLYAIAATVIFSFHPYLFYYAQEARCYSLLIFLITSNLILVHSLVKKPSLLKTFFLGVLNFLIFYTHYISGLILFCQFIYLALIFRRKIMYLALIYITPILLVLIRFTRKQYDVLFFSTEMSKQKSNVPLSSMDTLVQAIPPLYISVFVLVIFLLVLVYFLFQKIKMEHLLLNQEFQFKMFILFTPLLCILILFGLGKVTNVFHERYLIFTIPYIIISFFVFAENKIILSALATIIVVFEIANIEFGKSKGMDYKFCAVLTKEIQKKGEVNILVQTHDVISLFVYYHDRELYESKKWRDRDVLSRKNIYYIDNVDDLINTRFDESKPVLFFQTYQRKDDDIKITELFKSRNYQTFTTNQITGVKFTYLQRVK